MPRSNRPGAALFQKVSYAEVDAAMFCPNSGESPTCCCGARPLRSSRPGRSIMIAWMIETPELTVCRDRRPALAGCARCGLGRRRKTLGTARVRSRCFRARYCALLAKTLAGFAFSQRSVYWRAFFGFARRQILTASRACCRCEALHFPTERRTQSRRQVRQVPN
jgi:hypothetical protein